MRAPSTLPAALVAALLAPVLALAASPAAANPAAVLKCTEIADPQARLACFDRTVPALRNAPPAAVPAPGASGPGAGLGAERTPEGRAAATAAAEADVLTATVTGVRQREPNVLIFTLDNGQTWRQTESAPLSLKAGAPVRIERGIFGSYNMTVPGRNRLFKVTRVE